MPPSLTPAAVALQYRSFVASVMLAVLNISGQNGGTRGYLGPVAFASSCCTCIESHFAEAADTSMTDLHSAQKSLNHATVAYSAGMLVEPSAFAT